ncbi:MAG: hypothetical protein M3Y19_02495, partial [Actinomycetota bacterium]|nr:hypothetical protein [Actinomycetota bacterium]
MTLMTATPTGGQSTASGREELRRPDGSPMRVLVVDDEATPADLLSMAMRYEGWEVRSAGDGLTAVRLAQELVLTTALGAVIVRRTLRPLQRVAATATRVSGLPLERGEV